MSRSKRLRGRYRGPAKPLWSDGLPHVVARITKLPASSVLKPRDVRRTPGVGTRTTAPGAIAFDVLRSSRNLRATYCGSLSNFCCLPGRAGGLPVILASAAS